MLLVQEYYVGDMFAVLLVTIPPLLILQGLTVRLEEGRIKVSRILVDSIIDRQGLVQCGDIILQESCATYDFTTSFLCRDVP